MKYKKLLAIILKAIALIITISFSIYMANDAKTSSSPVNENVRPWFTVINIIYILLMVIFIPDWFKIYLKSKIDYFIIIISLTIVYFLTIIFIFVCFYVRGFGFY